MNNGRKYNWESISKLRRRYSFVEKYCRDEFDPVKHASRSTIAQYNSKIQAAEKRIVDLPGDAVYSIRWNCKHFGTFKARVPDTTAGKTQTRSHYTRGCGFFMYLAWCKVKKAYDLKNAQLDHNHEIGADVFGMYAANKFELRHCSRLLFYSTKPQSAATTGNCDIMHW